MKYINHISRCITLYRSTQMCDSGLRGCHHAYIFQVCRSPGIAQEQLAKNLSVHKSSVTRQLSALEQAGFIKRQPSEKDRRVLCVFPTDKALEILPQVRALAKSWNEQVLEDFTDEERTLLLSMLMRIQGKAKDLLQMEV